MDSYTILFVKFQKKYYKKSLRSVEFLQKAEEKEVISRSFDLIF